MWIRSLEHTGMQTSSMRGASQFCYQSLAYINFKTSRTVYIERIMLPNSSMKLTCIRARYSIQLSVSIYFLQYVGLLVSTKIIVLVRFEENLPVHSSAWFSCNCLSIPPAIKFCINLRRILNPVTFLILTLLSEDYSAWVMLFQAANKQLRWITTSFSKLSTKVFGFFYNHSSQQLESMCFRIRLIRHHQ